MKRKQVMAVAPQRGRFGVTTMVGEAWQPHFAVYYGEDSASVVAHFFEEIAAQEYVKWRNGEERAK